jgi:hypothetical protein
METNPTQNQSENTSFGELRVMKHLKSQIINRKIKLLLCKTIIRHVLAYGAETWVMTKQDEKHLRCPERKILRKIFGP